MGVKGMMKLIENMIIKKQNKTCITHIHLNSLNQIGINTVVVDYQQIMHKLKRAKQNLNQLYNPNNWILQLINLIDKFKKYSIRLIFVFNCNKEFKKLSLAECEKSEITYSAKKHKSSNFNINIDYNITPEDVSSSKNIFDKMGILYFHLENHDSNTVLQLLCKYKIANCIFTYNSDALIYDNNTSGNGLPGNDLLENGSSGNDLPGNDSLENITYTYIIRNLDFLNDTIDVLYKTHILELLGITSNQLIDLSILSGTDFNHKLNFSTLEINLVLIKKYKTIENIIRNLSDINIEKDDKLLSIPNYNFEYNKVRDIFNLKSGNDNCKIIIDKLNIFEIEENNKNIIEKQSRIKYMFQYIRKICNNSYLYSHYNSKLIYYFTIQYGSSSLLNI
jgi:hypothetical protein